MQNKLVGHQFDIEQQHHKQAMIQFKDSNHFVIVPQQHFSKINYSGTYSIQKIGSKRYLLLPKIPKDILNIHSDSWKTAKININNQLFYIYMIENLDDEVFHLSILAQQNQPILISHIDSISELTKAAHQRHQLTLRLK